MAAVQSHALPAPPGATGFYSEAPSLPPVPQQYYQQQQQQQQHLSQKQPVRTRTSRAFSYRSDKSNKSNGNNHPNLQETSAEKEAKRLHTKADPTLAMNEAEPSAVQATVKSSLASLRNIQHKDQFGNPIAEPDKSNPTRSRWERPLDTIRSFEAAIDGGYNRRSVYRTESETVPNANRRSSYYGNNGPARFPTDSYYGGRPQSTYRLEGSQLDLRSSVGGQRESYFEAPNPAFSQSQYGQRQRLSRIASEPGYLSHNRGPDPNVYPIPNNHRSYETVASAAGSGMSADPSGYQTDPTSSDNSSVDRTQPPPPPKSYHDRTYNAQPSYNVGVKYPPASTNQQTYMAQPSHTNRASIARKPTAPAVTPRPLTQDHERPGMGDKRKSWFARKFSKHD